MNVQQQSHGSSTSNKSKKSKENEDTTLAQGVVDDSAELGADNDGDLDMSANEEPTLRDKEGRLVESDDTKRASGNRSTSQYRQHDQHGNMTRSDDRRRGKGGGHNSVFIRH